MPKVRPLQEVIMVNGTQFANRTYCEKNNNPLFNNFIEQNRQFKDDCSGTHLKFVLPELFRTIDAEAKLYLWQLREYDNTFLLEMSEEPMGLNVFKSIDPYVFLESINYN